MWGWVRRYGSRDNSKAATSPKSPPPDGWWFAKAASLLQFAQLAETTAQVQESHYGPAHQSPPQQSFIASLTLERGPLEPYKFQLCKTCKVCPLNLMTEPSPTVWGINRIRILIPPLVWQVLWSLYHLPIPRTKVFLYCFSWRHGNLSLLLISLT